MQWVYRYLGMGVLFFKLTFGVPLVFAETLSLESLPTDSVFERLDFPAFRDREEASREVHRRLRAISSREETLTGATKILSETASPEIRSRVENILERAFREYIPTVGTLNRAETPQKYAPGMKSTTFQYMDIDPAQRWIAYAEHSSGYGTSHSDVAILIHPWNSVERKSAGEPSRINLPHGASLQGIYLLPSKIPNGSGKNPDRLLAAITNFGPTLYERDSVSGKWEKKPLKWDITTFQSMVVNPTHSRAIIFGYSAGKSAMSLVDLSTLTVLKVIPVKHYALAKAINFDEFAISTSSNNAIQLFKPEGKLEARLILDSHSYFYGMNFFPNSYRFARQIPGGIGIERITNPADATWMLKTEQTLSTSEEFFMTVSSDEEFLFTASNAGMGSLIELASGQTVLRERVAPPWHYSQAIKFSHDGQMIFSVSQPRVSWIHIANSLRKNGTLGATITWPTSLEVAWKNLRAKDATIAYAAIHFILAQPSVKVDTILENIKDLSEVACPKPIPTPMTDPNHLAVKRSVQLLKAKLAQTDGDREAIRKFRANLKTDSLLFTLLKLND